MKKLLYIEVAEKIMSSVLNGEIKPGEKIKSVREIAIEYKVNPKTVQKAFDYLEELGIFSSIVGGGRYLSKDAEVLEAVKKQLISFEVKEFVFKLKKYGYTKKEIIEYIEGEYE